jgi:sugar lactone lactonase YvrE
MRFLGLLVILALVSPWGAAAGAEVVEFDAEAWDLSRAQVVEYLGRQSVIGTAVLKDVVFEDGVIEFDVAAKDGKSYPGVFFRMQSPGDYEHFYIRPHRTGLYADALQYTPNIGGVGSWQLYNGPGYTAATPLEKGRWVSVRLEVKGDQARVFLDDAATPGLVIDHLEHGYSKGGIAVNTLGTGNAFISKFRYREGGTLQFDAVPDPGSAPGAIVEWQLSQVLGPRDVEDDLHPSRYGLVDLEWRDVKAEPSGLLDLSRHAQRNRGRVDCIFARATVHAEEATRKRFRFGYSDAVSIFLNGEPVFQGSSAYTQRDSSFLGILGTFDNLHLPLKKGDNELLVLVAEQFGGWGVKFQDTTATFRHPAVAEAWKTAEEFQSPETVLFDPQREVLYVSNYDAFNPSRGQGGQSIARLALDGKVLDAAWVSGLFNPTGMAMHGGRLFVVERAGLVEIDPDSGEITNRIALPSPRFLNDIAIDGEGTIYVSDPGKGVVYRSTADSYEEWLIGPGMERPNGLHVAGGKLLVGTNGDQCLKSVDLASGEVSTVAKLWPGIIDGIESDGKGNYLVSHAEGRVYRITADGEVTRLLDLEPTGASTANFAYVADRQLLVIPDLRNDAVLAVKLSLE